jgi:DNA primase catalytic core
MGRVSEEELERLKREISLERLVTSKGVVLRKKGEELHGLCPFHEDHDPSLVVNPIKNLWHCLGACQTGGSVIDWVMKAEGVSFRHAVELLKKDFSPLAAPATKRSSKIKVETLLSSEEDVQESLRQVLNFYTDTLKNSPEALEYLAKRGIDSGDAIELFRLGYANRTLGYHLPNKQRKEGKELRTRLEEIGIYRKSGHEHFHGSVVIPIFDESGIITEIYGRKIGNRLRRGTPLHLYLPGPHRGVWNKEALKSGPEVILCESLIDALTFWCAGYRNVTASYGIEGFTKDHLEAFKKHGIKRVLIAYDRDEPGEKASTSLAAKLMDEGFECFRIQFPKGMDANEYALSVKPAEKSLGIVIRKALWMGKGKAPPVTTTSSSVGAFRETPEDGNVSECRAVVNLPPLSENEPAEWPEINTGPTINASPIPAPTPIQIKAEIKNGEVVIPRGDRRWRIRGLEKNMAFEVLRVNVLCGCSDLFHVDTFDLYNARHRQAYLKVAAEELQLKESILKKDLGRVLLKLEELQEQQISQALNPDKDKKISISNKDKSAAMKLLKSPKLLEKILTDFEKCGVVGEETNKLVGYLSAVSRKLEEPLAVVIQSSSAAGKSSLMEAILGFFPHEEQVKYSAMTGQSLFYMGETDLQHKILAIVEEEGAERASYALKLLQSEGELTIASTGKDPSTGRLETQEYRVEGPVMIFLTTTAIEIDEELLNRCVVLTVDEDRRQTRAIHKLQRERQTLEGLLARRDKEQIMKLHQDAQRLLRPLLVANPFANELTFLDDRTRTRRDHMKYLTLIRAIALLHQYQRPTQTVTHNNKSVQYIEVTLEDIEVANQLSHQVLGRSLDELSPQTRRLLVSLDEMVSKHCKKLVMERCDFRFTQREIREWLGIGNTQLKVHLSRLVELEYVLIHHGGRGQQFIYELAYEGQGKDGKPFMSRLLDVSKIKKRGYDANRSGQKVKRSDSGRPQVGPKSGGCRGEDRPVFPNDPGRKEPINGKSLKNAHLDGSKKTPYTRSRTDDLTPLAADSKTR